MDDKLYKLVDRYYKIAEPLVDFYLDTVKDRKLPTQEISWERVRFGDNRYDSFFELFNHLDLPVSIFIHRMDSETELSRDISREDFKKSIEGLINPGAVNLFMSSTDIDSNWAAHDIYHILQESNMVEVPKDAFDIDDNILDIASRGYEEAFMKDFNLERKVLKSFKSRGFRFAGLAVYFNTDPIFRKYQASLAGGELNTRYLRDMVPDLMIKYIMDNGILGDQQLRYQPLSTDGISLMAGEGLEGYRLLHPGSGKEDLPNLNIAHDKFIKYLYSVARGTLEGNIGKVLFMV